MAVVTKDVYTTTASSTGKKPSVPNPRNIPKGPGKPAVNTEHLAPPVIRTRAYTEREKIAMATEYANDYINLPDLEAAKDRIYNTVMQIQLQNKKINEISVNMPNVIDFPVRPALTKGFTQHSEDIEKCCQEILDAAQATIEIARSKYKIKYDERMRYLSGLRVPID